MLTAQTMMTEFIERLVNQALQYDPATQRRLQSLFGEVFGFHITQPNFTIFVMVQEQGVRLMRHWDGDCEAQVTGNLKDFIALARSEDKTKAMMEFGLHVQGSTQSLGRLQAVADKLNLDWEAAISDKTGDMAGHLIADGLRFFGSSAKAVVENLGRSSKNYLKEESQLLAHPVETAKFEKQVSELRFSTDRLEARVQHITQQLQRIRETRQ